MNKTQLSQSLDRMDRLYPHVMEADYREEVRRLGAAFPPLARTARALKDLLDAHRGLPHAKLEEEMLDRARGLHDELRVKAQALLSAAVWPYD